MTYYELQVGRAARFVEGASQNDWESIVCPRDAGHRRAGRRLTPLYVDVLSWNVVDFSRTMLSDVVITKNTLDVLHEAGLTGFEVRPARVEGLAPGAKRFNLPKLWEFVVIGSGGPAHEASGIVQLLNCDECGLVRYSAFEHGIQVDESAYDGSDFFTVAEYPKYVLVNPRARGAIEQAGLTNVAFVESAEIEWPCGVVKPRSGAG